MDTPIYDFVSRYRRSGTSRLHMPGHKGIELLGPEDMDITEVGGADSLYEAEGIIRASEENASRLFGCPTYYSTEGSSQCIRAMLLLAQQYMCDGKERLRILAGRNAHKTFLSACALLDADVCWLWPKEGDSYLSCTVDADILEAEICRCRPHAVYLTAPDYLGNTVDIAALAGVCHNNGVLLLVDNAHGAYLRFLEPSRHPMDLGADLCCDSAHKTLPALTGAAYLHTTDAFERISVKQAMAMFGSTSPSYLILQSLDLVNRYIAEGYSEKLRSFTGSVQNIKRSLADKGFSLCGDELLKITISTKPWGYTGYEISGILRKNGIECEFADPDFIVFMVTPETGEKGLVGLRDVLLSISRSTSTFPVPPQFSRCRSALTVRKAALAPCEIVSAEESCGRILAAATVGCPPAVPIVVCGERIDDAAVECFRYYGIECCLVVRE